MTAIVNQNNEIIDFFWDVITPLHPGDRYVHFPDLSNEIRIVYENRLFVSNPGVHSNIVYFINE
jgi:hypothetical protein